MSQHNFPAGDQLWESGSRQQLPDCGPPDGLEFLNKTEENAYETDDEDEECENRGDDPEEQKTAPEPKEEKQVKEVSEKIEAISIDEEEEDPRSPQEIMDELLEHAFLQSWKTSAKKAELPMLTSNLFRVHMMAQCPKDKTLDVKKSSYKKLSKFLAKMAKEKVIEVKELQKGVESVTKVNLEHELIQRCRVVKVDRTADDEQDKEEVLPCDRPYEPPKITELFTVSGNTLAFFKLAGLKKGDALNGVEVREAVKKYVKENDLQDLNNRSVVNLDPALAGVVLNKGENGVTSLVWEEVLSRLQAKMSTAYAMQFEGFPAQVRKGKLDPVEISTATRSGNKKVTLVHNLDLYRIDPVQFAQRCQASF